jgi:SecD/SecF fusion protein
MIRLLKMLLSISLVVLLCCQTSNDQSEEFELKLTLEVSEFEIIHSFSDKSVDTVFLKAMFLANEKLLGSDKDFISLFEESILETDPNTRLAAIFLYEFRDKNITVNSTNEEVIEAIRSEFERIIESTIEKLKTRIKLYGISEKSVQFKTFNNQIQIEISGIDDPVRVKNILTLTGKLGFWETYLFSEVHQYITDANTYLRDNHKEIKKNLSNDSDNGLNQYDKTNRFFTFLIPDYEEKEGMYYPGVHATIGHAPVGDTAEINKLVLKATDALPRDLKLIWTAKPNPSMPDLLDLIALKITTRKGDAVIGGEAIVDAHQESDKDGRASIHLQMDARGTKVWKRMTGENIGRQIAIVIDNLVYACPKILDEISNGKSSISGIDMTGNEAHDLAIVIKAGALPFRLKITDEKLIKRE